VISSWIAQLVLQHNQRDVTMVLGNGRRYRISRMGPGVYREWMRAPSKGVFWHEQVKNQYRVTRLA
jgi:hypothetical protein